MTTLGSVQLSDNLVLDGIESAPGIAWSQRRTIMGASVVQVTPVSGGRRLTLVSGGHLTISQAEAVRTVMEAGQPVTLVHHRGTFSVLVVSIEVEPDTRYADPAPGDTCSGTITMIEV